MMKDLIAARRMSRKNNDLLKIGDILIDQYEQQNKAATFLTKKTFSPSGVGQYQGSCPRYWYVAFNGAEFEYKNTPLSVAIMANGTAAHDRLQTAFEKAGVLSEKELPVEISDPPVFGYADAIFEIDGEKIVAEFKTTNQEAFEFRKLSQQPAEAHKLQILLYLKATGNKRGAVIYENRNTLQLLVIPVELDETNEQWLEQALEWMRTVRSAYENKQKPKQPFQQRNKICQECPVYETCWSDKDFDVEIPKLDLKAL